MISTVKYAKFLHQSKALIINMVRQAFASDVFACLSIATHNITMWLFDGQIRLNNSKNMVKHRTSGIPTIDWSIKFLFGGPSVAVSSSSAIGVFKPIDKNFIAARDGKGHMPLPTRSIFSLFDATNIHTSFSVNNASQIGILLRSLICVKNNIFSHINSFVYYQCIINEYKVHGERLSVRGRQRRTIV